MRFLLLLCLLCAVCGDYALLGETIMLDDYFALWCHKKNAAEFKLTMSSRKSFHDFCVGSTVFTKRKYAELVENYFVKNGTGTTELDISKNDLQTVNLEFYDKHTVVSIELSCVL